MMALDALYGVVPPKIVLMINKKETAKEAWDAIATMRVGDDRVKKATAQQLCQKFNLATFEDGETVEDYALRLSGMAAHLTTLGQEVKDGEMSRRCFDPCRLALSRSRSRSRHYSMCRLCLLQI
jgi:hypothetical protein